MRPFDADHGPDARAALFLIWFLIAMFLAVRIVSLLALASLMDGQEFTTDQSIFLTIGEAPLGFARGKVLEFWQFPPLIGLHLAPMALTERWLGGFSQLRLLFILFEMMAYLLTLVAVHRAGRANLALIGFMWVVAPIGLFTSVIMCQDEVIVAFYASSVILLLVLARDTVATAAAALGFVAGKSFLLLHLAALLVATPRSPAKWGCALLIVGIPYAVFLGGREESFTDFYPINLHSVSIWALITYMFELPYQREISLFAFVILFTAVSYHSRLMSTIFCLHSEQTIQIFFLGFHAFLIAFYHVNPEYYFILVPYACFVFRRSLVTLGIFLTVTSLSWTVNFFYGVMHAVDHAKSDAFVALYERVFGPADPAAMWLASIVLFNAASALALVYSTVHVRHSGGNPRQPNGANPAWVPAAAGGTETA